MRTKAAAARTEADAQKMVAQTTEQKAVQAGVPPEQIRLMSAMWWLNDVLLDINAILGSATKPPDTKTCVALTAQAKEPKVLTLKPSGQITVAAGSKGTVAVKGVTTKAEVFPYFRRTPACTLRLPQKLKRQSD